ncbi:MAG TPA: hypothetical protein VLJ21_03525 [Candidatus Binatia bacterium]|nr:hypothetical protein [Candidatus Binatia bacterium]
MKVARSLIKLSVLVSIACAVAAPQALAYLDPGTGSMLVQILIGFLAGIALFFKNFWLKLFRRKQVSHDAIKKDQ